MGSPCNRAISQAFWHWYGTTLLRQAGGDIPAHVNDPDQVEMVVVLDVEHKVREAVQASIAQHRDAEFMRIAQ